MPTPHAFDYDTVYSRKVRVGIPRSPRVVVPYDFAVGHPDASTLPSQALGDATARMLLPAFILGLVAANAIWVEPATEDMDVTSR